MMIIGKDLVGSRRDLIVRHSPDIRLEGVRKITKTSIRIPGRRDLQNTKQKC
jgi:hypothetical protein